MRFPTGNLQLQNIKLNFPSLHKISYSTQSCKSLQQRLLACSVQAKPCITWKITLAFTWALCSAIPRASKTSKDLSNFMLSAGSIDDVRWWHRSFSHYPPEHFSYQIYEGLQQIHVFFLSSLCLIKLEVSVFPKKMIWYCFFHTTLIIPKLAFSRIIFPGTNLRVWAKGYNVLSGNMCAQCSYQEEKSLCNNMSMLFLVHSPIYNYLGPHTVIWKPFALRLPGLMYALTLKTSSAPSWWYLTSLVGGI